MSDISTVRNTTYTPLFSPYCSFISQQSVTNQNVKVVVRVRPPLQIEFVEGCPFRPCVRVSKDDKNCGIMEYNGDKKEEGDIQRDIQVNPRLCAWYNYSFDHVYNQNSTQQ